MIGGLDSEHHKPMGPAEPEDEDEDDLLNISDPFFPTWLPPEAPLSNNPNEMLLSGQTSNDDWNSITTASSCPSIGQRSPTRDLFEEVSQYGDVVDHGDGGESAGEILEYLRETPLLLNVWSCPDGRHYANLMVRANMSVNELLMTFASHFYHDQPDGCQLMLYTDKGVVLLPEWTLSRAGLHNLDKVTIQYSDVDIWKFPCSSLLLGFVFLIGGILCILYGVNDCPRWETSRLLPGAATFTPQPFIPWTHQDAFLPAPPDTQLEGLLTWASEHHLLPHRGLMRWDAQSAQMVLPWPADNLQDASVPKPDRLRQIHQETFIATNQQCYGYQEALKRYLISLVLDQGQLFSDSNLVSACQPLGSTFRMSVSDLLRGPCTALAPDSDAEWLKSFPDMVIRFIGTGDTASCVRQVARLFDPSFCRATFREDHAFKASEVASREANHLFAVSDFWPVLLKIDLLDPSEDTQQSFRKRTSWLCSHDVEHHPAADQGEEAMLHSCFASCLLHHLLTYGYGFHSWQNISFVPTLQDIPQEELLIINIINKKWICFVLGIIFVLVSFFYCGRILLFLHKKRQATDVFQRIAQFQLE